MHDESCLRELGNTCSRTKRINHYENLKDYDNTHQNIMIYMPS